MAFEFDNEIDFLLRKTSGQRSLTAENAAENAIHLDADDLIAFAENALPQLARQNLISHLADCNSCRETLSNLVLLNETADEETNIVVEPEKIVVAQSSWLDSLKKLFAVPTLGYAAASLAVLFVGVFAFIALRPVQENQTAQVVQTEAQPVETPTRKRSSAPAAEQKEDVDEPKPEETPAETPDPNANIPVQEISAPTTETADNLPPSVRITRGENSGNRNAASSELNVARNNSATSNSTATVPVPRQPQPDPSAVSGVGALKQEAPSRAVTSAPTTPKLANETKDKLLDRDKSDQSSEPDDSRESGGIVPSPANRSRAATDDDPRKLIKSKKSLETRTLNGRAFQKIGGVWTDAAYNSQNVTNVSRNSNEYKRLDDGLRSIAEKLNGEIIVVWQGRAYKIR